ncbi:MAG: RsmB/NOP family class I SAM-dependent RNA methyltransferase [Myxococcota bacterium]
MSGERFEDHYRAIFGSRWDSLRAALLNKNSQVARLNRFHPDPTGSLPEDSRPVFEGCYASASLEAPPATLPMPYYIMDAASVLAARALAVQSGDHVLDLCAAPGGKTLILAEAIGEDGTLTSNDSSRGRLARLRHVLDSYLPETTRQRVRVTAHDASRWGLYEPNRYRRVLLDAPCSSEAHVLGDKKANAQWTPARPKQLALRQGALLAAAVDSTEPGGTVVYSTCALDPRENDGVVAKILRKRKGRVELAPSTSPIGEASELGMHILPDATGFGPIYFAVLRRTT